MTRSDMLLAVLISSAAQIPALFYFAAYLIAMGVSVFIS